jgi:hypothetical protein
MPTELVRVGGILIAAGSALVFVLAFSLIRLRGFSEVNSSGSSATKRFGHALVAVQADRYLLDQVRNRMDMLATPKKRREQGMRFPEISEPDVIPPQLACPGPSHHSSRRTT